MNWKLETKKHFLDNLILGNNFFGDFKYEIIWKKYYHMKSTLRALNKNGCTITFEQVCLPISCLFAICIDYIFIELIKKYLIA
jgi:hypothetical protein